MTIKVLYVRPNPEDPENPIESRSIFENEVDDLKCQMMGTDYKGRGQIVLETSTGPVTLLLENKKERGSWMLGISPKEKLSDRGLTIEVDGHDQMLPKGSIWERQGPTIINTDLGGECYIEWEPHHNGNGVERG